LLWALGFTAPLTELSTGLQVRNLNRCKIWNHLTAGIVVTVALAGSCEAVSGPHAHVGLFEISLTEDTSFFRSESAEARKMEGPEVTFIFQFGLVRDTVTAAASTLGLKTLKDLACDFINRKVGTALRIQLLMWGIVGFLQLADKFCQLQSFFLFFFF
jgi:hypothetical protein